MIRIANGQGFWGDWLEAPVRLVEQGPIDYLALDYLAEITMSILQKQKEADPNLGYARDFPPLIARIQRRIIEREVRVIANAGGVNPVACAREVRRVAPSLKVAVVLGDDVFGRLDEFLAAGHAMKNMETGEPLTTIRDRILSANAYIGAFPLAEALAAGRRRGDCGPLHRYSAVARSHDSSFRLEAGRMGQTCGRNNCRTYCRMRRAMHWRKLPGGLAEHSGHGEHRLSDHRGRAGRALQYHQARGNRAGACRWT